jgi:transcriptional regulator
MYTPAPFAEESKEVLHGLIRDHSFGILVTGGGAGLLASHLPFLLDDAGDGLGLLRGHVARANPQWKALATGDEALVIFRGPHAYVSPSFYVTPQAVPTWNYVAVHVYGKPRLVEERGALLQLVTQLSARHESQRPASWSPAKVSADFLSNKLAGIVGFEVPVERILGKKKLSQNLSREDRLGVAKALEGDGEGESAAVAVLMRETLPPREGE